MTTCGNSFRTTVDVTAAAESAVFGSAFGDGCSLTVVWGWLVQPVARSRSAVISRRRRIPSLELTVGKGVT